MHNIGLKIFAAMRNFFLKAMRFLTGIYVVKTITDQSCIILLARIMNDVTHDDALEDFPRGNNAGSGEQMKKGQEGIFHRN